MAKQALLIDYEYCSGCQACEVACKQEHGYPVGVGGICLNEISTRLPNGRLRIDYVPFVTQYCDGCRARVGCGELPACVKHCQAATMYYGNPQEMVEIMSDRPRSVVYAV